MLRHVLPVEELPTAVILVMPDEQDRGTLTDVSFPGNDREIRRVV